MLPEATSSFYAGQRARVVETIAGARAEWGKLSSPTQFGRIATRLFSLLGAAQLGAARDGAAMVPAALEQTGFPEKALATVNPTAFVGWSSQGFRLDSLLWLAPSIAEQQGGPLVQQMAVGQLFLDRVVQLQIQDAGRAASGATITSTPNVGYVRMVNPPCCQHCAILGGKWYRYSAGFDRHEGCDCIHRPAHSHEAPSGYVDMVPSLEEISDLTDAQRRALADGADLNQVVNAYRYSTPSGRKKMYTSVEGSSRRGWYSYMRRQINAQRRATTTETVTQAGRRGAVSNYSTRRVGRRLTPEAIYSADIPREQAVRLLIENGYMLGDPLTLSRRVA